MWALFLLLATGAEVVGTLVGFGSSTIFLPVALFFVDFRVALVLVACLHIFGNLSRLGWFRTGLSWRVLACFGAPSVIWTLLGALLVNSLNQTDLRGILGLFLMAYAVLSFDQIGVKLGGSVMICTIGGTISGFLAGLIGTGGAIRGAFLSAVNLPKKEYLATMAVIALTVDLTRIPVYLASGFLGREFYWIVPALAGAAVIGSYVGKLLVARIPQIEFKRVVLVGIFLVGVKFVYDWVLPG